MPSGWKPALAALIAVSTASASPVVLCAVAAEASPALSRQPANALSDSERAQGFQLLWDGKTTAGWRSLTGTEIPKDRWAVRDGTLAALVPPPGAAVENADIVSERSFSSFELLAEFRLSRGANSGIKYFVRTGVMADRGLSSVGLEYQLIDDDANPDAGMRGGVRSLASLYDVLAPAKDKPQRPLGDWRQARILVRGRHVEHWLDGIQVLVYERGSADFEKRVAISKHRIWPGYGRETSGPILLQHHGGGVAFRSLKIRELAPAP